MFFVKTLKIAVFAAFVLIIISLSSLCLTAQNSQKDSLGFYDYPNSIHKPRLISLSTTAGLAYIGTSIGLYNTWYKQYPQEKFHFFNDFNEWQNIDKMGHVFTAYFQGVAMYNMSKWTGLNDKKSILVGVIAGSLFQSTIEVMDGFSSKWGFSVADMGANILGTSSFALQQKLWGTQKIQLKISSWPVSYLSHESITDPTVLKAIESRADDLFGSTYLERFLKDYNAQSYWMSFNLHSFLPNSKMPPWLNLALGYSGQNMLGGFSNNWTVNGAALDFNQVLPRRHQYLLGLDIDFTKIKTKHAFLKLLFSGMNFYKFPMPTLEYNSEGKFSFHLVFRN